MSIILSVQELKDKVNDNRGNITIIDVRSSQEAYNQSHIAQALFLDYKKDLTGENTFLPDVKKLANKLGSLGVSNDTSIVFYDQGNHRAASKAWVVLNYLGHKDAYILDGGLQAWIDAGNDSTAALPTVQPVQYYINLQHEVVVDMEDVKNRLEAEDTILIDSRAYERYTGKVEPKYKKAGHIPGAKNFHTKLIFNDNGSWKEKSNLQTHFASLNHKDEVIVSCGSGNSACMNLVALKEAGFEDVKLYPGGFSEWIEDEDNEVATGDE